MTALDNAIFEQLIRPDFDISVFTWDNCVELAGEVITNRELSNKILGKLAAGLEGKRGDKVVQKFATDIENTTGLKVSAKHIANCRGVYRRLLPHINKIPADWAWNAWRLLAYTENPGEWIDKAVNAGWTSAMVVREVQMAKGLKLQNRHECPKCGYEFDD